jgi:glycosyltransferase involved in cell wall biosynthesis
LIFWCLGWWFRPKTWQRSFYRDGPDAILAPCEAVRRGFLGSPAFMSPDRVQVVNPGVDTVLFRPRPADREALRRELDLPSDVPIVTLLARFQVVKGHDVFLDAARLLADRFPTARFVIAGENAFGVSADEAFRRRILGRARSDPVLRERVTFLGWTEHPERLLAASDVLVCSSRFESYGMALVEAMACGLPVVSTQVGGPSETVLDGVTGYLVPPERPDLIADRVAVLLGNPGLRQQMGTQGRRRTEARFESRQYAAAVSAVIESLAAVRDHSPRRAPG